MSKFVSQNKNLSDEKYYKIVSIKEIFHNK